MAFELHFPEHRESIGHHEEGLFKLLADSDRYPKLNWVWENFYKSPVIPPEVANSLTHECIGLKRELIESEDRIGERAVERLIVFFSRAYLSGQTIRCSSD